MHTHTHTHTRTDKQKRYTEMESAALFSHLFSFIIRQSTVKLVKACVCAQGFRLGGAMA